MTTNSIMHAIKRAVSPLRQTNQPTAVHKHPASFVSTPFTKYVLENLELEAHDHRMIVMAFAPHVQTDCDAKVLDFDEFYHLLGTEKRNALRILKRTFQSHEIISLNSEQNTIGRPRDMYLLSVNQFEEVLLAANAESGKKWRKLVLRIKNLVVNYMKMEIETSARAANERLAIEEARRAESDAKRDELEAVQSKLQATIESQKKREEKKEARKKQQKQPLETAYLISNNPGGQGPFKCGMTEKEAKQRAKAMQTGNHEPVIVVAEIPCMNADLIEKVMHQIFYDYRTNDRLEWFDAPLDSMTCTLRFVVESIDGLNRVDHDEIDISLHLESVLTHMRGAILPVRDTELEGILQPPLTSVNDSYADFWTDCMVHHGDRNRAVNRTAVKAVFKDWLKRHRFPDMSYAQMRAYWDLRMTYMDTTRACGKVKGYVEWDVKESLKNG